MYEVHNQYKYDQYIDMRHQRGLYKACINDTYANTELMHQIGC